MSEQIKKVKDFLNKEKCECGKIAVWVYMPAAAGENPYYCDDCVHRGCSCDWNYASKDAYSPTPLEEDYLPTGIEGVDWKWIVREKDEDFKEIKKGEIWTSIDEKGREYPCCEYFYEEKGFDKN
jgi:hypothetical protein